MKIGVVGLGLIGGSIFKSLKGLNYDVVGISKSQKGENIYSDWSILSECSLVFVCSAMNKVLNDLDYLEQFVTPDTIVSDVSSLKEFVSQKEYKYNFVPTHPMAGTEFAGFENSFEGLFQGAKWAITPKDGIVPDILQKIIEDLGAKIIITTPKEHDLAVAKISHAPMVIAQAMFKSIEGNELAKALAASGFRDMTRLAMSNVEMASDMVQMNSDNIQKALLSLYASVGELIKEDYSNKILSIKEQRETMYKDGKNIQ